MYYTKLQYFKGLSLYKKHFQQSREIDHLCRPARSENEAVRSEN